MADESEEKTEPAAPSCIADSNFAVICSFLEKFSPAIGIPNLPFTQLQEMLEDQDRVSQVLIDLHVKLLRKARRSSFTLDKWEKALTKFAHSYSQQDGWELERFTYKKASLGVKLRLLKMLLEAQFDQNVKFKNELNKLAPSELRLKPLGHDANGLQYWCQFDPACNVRVYREDVEEKTWDLIAQDRLGLVNLINSLSDGEGQQELDLIMKEEEASLDIAKTSAENGQSERNNDEEEESEDGEENDESNEEEEDDESSNEEEEEEESEETETPTGDNDAINDVSGDVSKTDEVEENEHESKDEKPNSSMMKTAEFSKSDSPESPKEIAQALVTQIEKEEKSAKVSVVASEKKEKEESNDNVSIDLTMSKPPPTAKPLPVARQPGSKLEEIFKTKIDSFSHSRSDDKTSILSQMAARFNSVNDSAVEDLSTRKKPRLDVPQSKAECLVKDDKPQPPELGEAIEENVMLVRGEGSGAECNASNPFMSNHDLCATDAPLQVIGVFNASSEESMRNALRQCILDDSSKTMSSENNGEELQYTREELDVLERVRQLNSRVTSSSKEFEFGPTISSSKDFVFEASEVIEEDVMYFSGCGAGHDNDTGNPGEASKDEASSSRVEIAEKKTTKKLWTIDAICNSKSDADVELDQNSTHESNNVDTQKKHIIPDAESPLVDESSSKNYVSADNDNSKLTDKPSEKVLHEVTDSNAAVQNCDEKGLNDVTDQVACEIVDSSNSNSKDLASPVTIGNVADECKGTEATDDADDSSMSDKPKKGSDRNTDNSVVAESVCVKDLKPPTENVVEDLENNENLELVESDENQVSSPKNADMEKEKLHKSDERTSPDANEELAASSCEPTSAAKPNQDDQESNSQNEKISTPAETSIPENSTVSKKDDESEEKIIDSDKPSSETTSSTGKDDKPDDQQANGDSLEKEASLTPELKITELRFDYTDITETIDKKPAANSLAVKTEIKSEPNLDSSVEIKYKMEVDSSSCENKTELALEKADNNSRDGVSSKKPRGRKSRSNTVSTEGGDDEKEDSSKLESKVEEEEDKKDEPRSCRRSARSTSAAAKLVKPEAISAKKTKKESKSVSASQPVEKPSKPEEKPDVDEEKTATETVTQSRGSKRKRNVKNTEKSDGDAEENDSDSRMEEDAATDEKKPRLKGTKVAPTVTPPAKEEKPNSKGKRKVKRSTVLGLTERDLKGVEIVEPETPSGGRMRASRRIAMLKIKEDADRRTAYEETCEEVKGKKKKINNSSKNEKNFQGSKASKLLKGSANKLDKSEKKRKKNKKGVSEEEEEEPLVDESKKRRRKKDRFKYNIDRPWASSSDDEDENIEEEEEDHLEFMGMEDDDDVVGKAISDHEFSCDEDLETKDGEEAIVPVRRARTAVRPKDKPSESVEEDVDENKDEVEDYKCEKCGKDDNPDWILLCDSCDKGYHAACLHPALMLIPEGDWFCPVCQHAELVKKLKDVLRTFEKNSKKRDNEELRRKRLAYVGISLANVLPDAAGNKVKKPGTKKNRDETDEMEVDGSSNSRASSSSEESSSESSEDEDDEPVYQLRQRRSAANNYRFNDYDQLIDSAIQDEMVPGGGEGYDSTGIQPTENGQVPQIKSEVDLKGSEADEVQANDADRIKEEEETKEGEEEEEGDVKKGWRPPVVPKRSSQLFSGRKKPKKLCNLDVVSDENDSDEDFKGSSSEEDDEDFSEGSDDSGVYRKSRTPLRRSGRARQSRVDKDFIHDESDEEYNPRSKKNKKKRDWSETSESSSDRSWGCRKKKSANRSFSRKTSRSRKKKKRKFTDSDSDVPKKKSKSKKPKIRYGLSADEDDDGPLTRTRGKKMNYTEIHGSDTEEEERINRIKGRKTLSDMEAEDEEFVLDKEEEEEFMGGVSFVRKAPQRIRSSDDEDDEDADRVDKLAAKKDTSGLRKEVNSKELVKPSTTATEVRNLAVKSPSVPNVKTSVPSVSQQLPPTKPALGSIANKSPAILKKTQRIESDEDEGDVDGPDEESEVEDEEDDDESEEEKVPRRQIPPPVPSLNIRIPGRPRPVAVEVNAIQSKLKEALNNTDKPVAKRPLESEALLRLREKLASAANRPGLACVPTTTAASTDPSELKSTPAPKPAVIPPLQTTRAKSPSLPQPTSATTTPESSPEKEPPKEKPLVNSIRVVSTQKLLANPHQQETLLKRPLPPPLPPPEQAMLMRGNGGMLIVPGFPGGGRPPIPHHGHHPPPLGIYYGGSRGPGMGPPPAAPAGLDPATPGRFHPRPPPPSQAPPAHHQLHQQHQQRRFPDRGVYGPVPPGAGFHGGGGGGFYPSAPGATPFPMGSPGPPPPPTPEVLQQLPPSEFQSRSPPPSSDAPRVGSAGGGEFGGLVSYFSSQAQEEDDALET